MTPLNPSKPDPDLDASPEPGGPDAPHYWFPAKRYGWGWGTPRTWQGWAAFGVYLVAIVSGMALIDVNTRPELLAGYLVCISAVLLYICWRKGEPPRWRWRGRD